MKRLGLRGKGTLGETCVWFSMVGSKAVLCGSRLDQKSRGSWSWKACEPQWRVFIVRRGTGEVREGRQSDRICISERWHQCGGWARQKRKVGDLTLWDPSQGDAQVHVFFNLHEVPDTLESCGNWDPVRGRNAHSSARLMHTWFMGSNHNCHPRRRQPEPDPRQEEAW